MRKVLPPVVKFVYLGEGDSEERLKRAYNRIFKIVRSNLESIVIAGEEVTKSESSFESKKISG